MTGTLNAAQAADKAIRSSLPLRCSEHPAAAGLPVSWPMHAITHLVGGCSDLQNQTAQEKRLNHLSDPRCGTQSMPSPDKPGEKLAQTKKKHRRRPFRTPDPGRSVTTTLLYEGRIERLTGDLKTSYSLRHERAGLFVVKR
ncbi:hypothetical protein L209DRAFT_116580 [Thermothelomyces heterothallicus CBS 203.75]